MIHLTIDQKRALIGASGLFGWEAEAPALAQAGVVAEDPLAKELNLPTRYRLTDAGAALARQLRAEMIAPDPRLELRWRQDPRTPEETSYADNAQLPVVFCDYGLVMNGRFALIETITRCGPLPADGEDAGDLRVRQDAESLGGLAVWVKSLSGAHTPHRQVFAVSVTFTRGGEEIDGMTFSDAVYTAGFTDAIIGSGRPGQVRVEADVAGKSADDARQRMIAAIQAELRDPIYAEDG